MRIRYNVSSLKIYAFDGMVKFEVGVADSKEGVVLD